MAENTADRISYLMQVENRFRDNLGSIRHWHNLKMATEGDHTWVKDIDAVQVNSVEIKSMPCTGIYYLKDNLLFALGSLVPSRTVPSLLWTPIDRALQVTLPQLNHNYFGINGKIEIKLVSADEERAPCATMTELDTLKRYISSAASVRLKHLKWAIIDRSMVMIVGEPLLPLPGESYWQMGPFLLPTGLELELGLFADVIEKQIGADNAYVVWNKDGSYFTVAKDKLQQLSISSFRMSIKDKEPV